MSTKHDGMPARVRGVEEQFARWRAGKQRRERIPRRLWAAAARLCGAYSVHRVSRWLRLNHTALQSEANKRRRRKCLHPRPAFVECRLPAGIIPGPTSAEYVVELDGRVPRIHVRGASVAEVAALVGALGGPGGWS
jgi:hypothetical protein